MDTTTKEGRERRLYEIEKSKVAYYKKKYKQTGKMAYAMLAQAITGDVDLLAGKHHS